MMTFDGWIFDISISGRDMGLRVIDVDGRVQMLRDEFIPLFCVDGDAKALRALARFIFDQHWDVRLARTQHKDPASDHLIVVLQIEVMNPHHFSAIVERVRRARPKLKYYNGDIPVLRQYMIARGIVPFSFCHFVVDNERRILGFEAIDSKRGGSPPNEAARHGKQKNKLMRKEA